MDIIPFDNGGRTEKYSEPVETGTTRAFYMKSSRERMDTRPVETPKQPECERIVDMPCPFWLRNSLI